MINNQYKYSKYLLLNLKLFNGKNTAVIKLFSYYINILIYNVITITSIISLLIFNSNTISNNTISMTKNYLNDMCKINKNNNKMNGGTVLPSSFHGNNDRHLYNFDEGVSLQYIDLNGDNLREQLGGCNDNNCNYNKQILISINRILKEHKIKANKTTKQLLANMIKYYLYYIIKILKNKKINNTVIKKILMKSKIKKLIS